MFQFLLFFLLIGFVILMVVLVSVMGFFRTLFGGLRSRNRKDTFNQQPPYEQGSGRRSQKKVIQETEGEYVDYEEIKSDTPEN